MIDPQGRNTKINLCDGCERKDEFPNCGSSDIEFGDATGNDNIIWCSNYLIEGVSNGN